MTLHAHYGKLSTEESPSVLGEPKEKRAKGGESHKRSPWARTSKFKKKKKKGSL